MDQKGKVTAVAKGTAAVTARYREFTAVCEIMVDAPIKNISVSPIDSIIQRGESLNVQAVVNPADTTDSKDCVWSSSRPDVAAVDHTGKITGITLGTTEITLKVGSFTAVRQITVNAPLEGISLTPAVTVHRGDSETLTVGLTPTDTTDKLAYTWTSSNPGVARVDGSGKVTAVQKGTATITADCNGFKASCAVSVDAPIKEILISPANSVVHRGENLDLKAVMNPADTTDPTGCIWVSADPGVASVSGYGRVSAIKLGTTDIILKVGEHTATRQITVDAPLEGIALAQAITVHRGESETLTPTLTPSDTTDKLCYTWDSSDKSVAAVDSFGRITALQKGTATIIANCNGFKASCVVTVDAPIKGIAISPEDSVIHRGESLNLNAIIDPPDTTDPAEISWTSSDPGIAVVDSSGKVSSVKLGTVEITLKVGNVTAKRGITVDAPLEGVGLDPSVTVHRGESTALIPALTPVDATDQLTYSWVSSDESIVSVDSSGNIMALQKGVATISMDCNGFKASCQITVDAPIKEISITPDSSVLHRGDTLNLSAAINPIDTTDSTSCAWTSSNPSVAAVDNTGKVSAAGLGSAEITLTIGSYTANCRVTVEAPLQGISLSPATTIHRGESSALVPSLTPADTTDTLHYTWVSSNPEAATVDQSGRVTAIQKGTAIITVDCNGFKSSCIVTVDAPIQNVTVSTANITLFKGDTSTLTASVTPVDTTESSSISWASDNPDIASIAANGKITALSPGTTTIWANSVRGLRAGCAVTVKDVYIVSVSGTNGTVQASKTTVRQGESVTLTATPDGNYLFRRLAGRFHRNHC